MYSEVYSFWFNSPTLSVAGSEFSKKEKLLVEFKRAIVICQYLQIKLKQNKPIDTVSTVKTLGVQKSMEILSLRKERLKFKRYL